MKGLGLSRLGLNIISTLGRQLGAGLIQLITIAVISRVYGPEGNGSYTVALLLPLMLASFLNLGISSANVYFLGAGKISPLTAWRNTMSLYIFIALIGVIIGGLILTFFSERWFPGVNKNLLWLALIIFPFSLLLNLVSSFFQGLQQFKLFNVVLLLQPIITLAGLLLLVATKEESIAWLLAAYLAGAVVTSFFSLKLLNPLLVSGVDQEKSYAKTSLTYGAKTHISNIVTFVNYKADIFIVNFFVGPAGAGIYVIAVQLAERLWILSTAVSTVLLPRLSELSHDEEKKKKLTPFICRWVLAATSLSSLCLLLVAKPLVSVVFGDKFIEAVSVLASLTPGVVLWAGGRVLSNDIAARGRPEINLYISLLVLLVNVVGNLLLIPLFGLVGASIATSLAYMVDFIVKAGCYLRVSGDRLSNLLIIKPSDFAVLRFFRHE